MIELTPDSFDAQVTDVPGKVLVDFWGEGCGPCRLMDSVLEGVHELLPDIPIARMSVTAYPQVAWAFDVVSVPTLVLFEDGVPKDQLVGAVPVDRVVEVLN